LNTYGKISENLFYALDELIDEAFHEDLGETGDLTTLSTIPEKMQGKGQLKLKEDGVVAGLPVFGRVYQKIDPAVTCSFSVEEGMSLSSGSLLGNVEGSMRSILMGERTALNFLQRLSGIATATHRYVDAVKGTHAKILDTRKTTPHFRALEKYAVRVGGGSNHRMGLYDMILIKDNHIDACGGIRQAVERCVSYLRENNHNVQIEVETRTIEEVDEALTLPVQRIMLDNMDLPTMFRAVEKIKGKLEVEASGNITLDSIRAVAETGVDYISIGAITHSIKALDISFGVSTVTHSQ
jgi:nicotinate-nucleotide pyrophosphorylase (carboxylating)